MAFGEYFIVLILVLVEHTLRETENRIIQRQRMSLNPCFSGTYSQSAANPVVEPAVTVLILVLVEHTLRASVLGVFRL